MSSVRAQTPATKRNWARAYVIGAGMTPFERPGARAWDYPDMTREAATSALHDAGIPYHLVDQAIAGHVFGQSCSAHRAISELGLTGIPIFDVTSNCSAGSSAIYLARQFVQGGIADCVLAVGFEKMDAGPLAFAMDSREQPAQRHFAAIEEIYDSENAPITAWLFGAAAREHMQKYGTTADQFAKVAEKNYRHAINNSYAQLKTEYTVDQILAAPMMYQPLTTLQSSLPADGAAAVLIASERFIDLRGLGDRAVEIAAQSMVTDTVASFSGSAINAVGTHLSHMAVNAVYDELKIGPEDIQVIELYDCFSSNELLTYEALGLCAVGEGGSLIEKDDVTYGGKWVINPSGGLLGRGHPLGATGVAQCVELVAQLRHEAGSRQVPGAGIGLQHNIGIGGGVVVTAYRKAM